MNTKFPAMLQRNVKASKLHNSLKRYFKTCLIVSVITASNTFILIKKSVANDDL